MNASLFTYVAVMQGAYYCLTGIWPLVSLKTFEKVSGPKTDHWLVQTVGVLILAIGLGLLVAAASNQITIELTLIAVGSAAGLTTIDLTYVSKKVIWPIYLLDAFVELILLIGWLRGWLLLQSAF